MAITSHVLDLTSGKPAAGVEIVLEHAPFGEHVEVFVGEAFGDRLARPEHGGEGVTEFVRGDPAVLTIADNDAIERAEDKAPRLLLEGVHWKFP